MEQIVSLNITISILLVVYNRCADPNKWSLVKERDTTSTLIGTGLRKVTVLEPRTTDLPYAIVFGPVIPPEWGVNEEWLYSHGDIRAISQPWFPQYTVQGGTFAKWKDGSRFLLDDNKWMDGLLFFHPSGDFGPAPLVMLKPFQEALENLLGYMVRWDNASLKEHDPRRSPYRDY